MKTLILAAMVLLIVGILSCGDDVTNNYYDNLAGAIIGNVTPVDVGTITLSGSQSYSATIDSVGYFRIESIASGVYDITISPSHHSKRRFLKRFVGAGTVIEMRNIPVTTLPYPIYEISPEDGTFEVPISVFVRIICDEELNVTDLNAKSSFDPPLTGEWEKVDYSGYLYDDGISYHFVPNQSLALATSYSLRIDKSVRTARGVAMDADLNIAFSTRGQAYELQMPTNYQTNRVERNSFQATMILPLCTDVDSVSRAIRFEPDIPGVWTAMVDGSYCSSRRVVRTHKFLPATLPLLPNAAYRAIITGAPIGVARVDTVEFMTSGVDIISVNPSNGQIDVGPGTLVYVSFNDEMDTVSVRQALTLTRINGNPIVGTFTWTADKFLIISHDSDPFLTGVYQFKVTTDAHSQDGQPLDREWESYFRVK